MIYMKNPLLSIIVPAYNEAESISRLIDSIVNQKFKNYELILINDGSTDNTYDIMINYSKKYNNIVVINKPNTGRGDTRNSGIKIANGEYITFADADDYYASNFFETIIPELKNGGFELLVFNAYFNDSNGNFKSEINEKQKSSNFLEKNGVKKYLRGDFCNKLGNAPWNKIYLKSVIDKYDLKYEPDKASGQDLVFNVLYAAKINKYRYINKKLYYYQCNIRAYTFTNVNTLKKYQEIISENLKYYDIFSKICIDNNVDDYLSYIGLFFLRRFPLIVLNETNNEEFLNGKNNIENYLRNHEISSSLSCIKIRYFDLKLFICYLFYRFKIYKLYYKILWKKKHNRILNK